MNEIIYRPAYEDEWDSCMNLAWNVFMKYDAPDYNEEGIENFREFVNDEELKKLFHKGSYQVFVAVCDSQIIGVISVRNGNHISLLFVDENYHRRRIGTGLVENLSRYMYTEMGQTTMTVNASPYAVGFYHKLGFMDTSQMQTVTGITFTPMEMYI